MSRIACLVLLGCVVMSAAAGPSRAGSITYDGSIWHLVVAGQYSGASSTTAWYPVFDGSTDGNTASVGGTISTATTTYGYVNPYTASFSSTWEFEREAGVAGGTHAWWHTRFLFTVNDPAGVAYNVSGFAVNSAGNTEFQVMLKDVSTHEIPFLSRHEYGPPGTYIVGGEPLANLTAYYGSPSGILLAGHTYEFGIRANSHVTTDDAPAARGGGEVKLTLTQVVAAPEPSSLGLLAVGALVHGIRTTRRRLASPA
ncbi:MAG: hypothetical protein SFX72_21630 [Isosphaeraceae bacterium]|nr:hypothetical protein [Isosphaeraceae bacterium]